MDYFNSISEFTLANEALANYDYALIDNGIAMEGFNHDLNKLFKTLRSNLAKMCSQANTLFKQEKYTEMCDVVHEMIKITEKAKAELKSMPVDSFRHVRRIASFALPLLALAIAINAQPIVGTIAKLLKIKATVGSIQAAFLGVSAVRGFSFGKILNRVITEVNSATKKSELKEEHGDDKNLANRKYRDYLYQMEMAIKVYNEIIAEATRLNAEKNKKASAQEAIMYVGLESYDLATDIDGFVSACEAMSANDFLQMGIALESSTNTEAGQKYQVAFRNLRQDLKVAKAKANAGDVNGCRTATESAITNLETAKREFDALVKDGTATGALIGFFAYGLKSVCMMFLAAFVTLPIGGIGAYVVSLKVAVEDLIDVIEALQKIDKGEQLSPHDFNLYTKSLEHNFVIMIKYCKEVSKRLNAKALKKSGSKPSEIDAAKESFLAFINAD